MKTKKKTKILMRMMKTEKRRTSDSMTLFILEGIDKSGKSTFGREFLTVSPDMSYVKRHIQFEKLPKNEKQLENYLRELSDIAHFFNNKKLFKHAILDRFHGSEAVYSKVKRGFDSMETSALWKFDDELAKLGVKMIYVRTDKDVVTSRMYDQNEQYVKGNEVALLLMRYDRFLNDTKIPYFIVDGTEDNQVKMHDIFDQATEPKRK